MESRTTRGRRADPAGDRRAARGRVQPAGSGRPRRHPGLSLLRDRWLGDRVPESVQTLWAGLAWLGACAAIYGQTQLGLPVFALSPLMLVAILCTGIWAAATWQCSRREIA
jgi:hypothetical protein